MTMLILQDRENRVEPRSRARRPSEYPMRMRVQQGRGIYLDGYWRFARALKPHEGQIVEVRPMQGGKVEIVDDLSLRRIMIGLLIEAPL